MISCPTTSTGVALQVGQIATKICPATPLYGVWGVRRGGEIPESLVGQIEAAESCPMSTSRCRFQTPTLGDKVGPIDQTRYRYDGRQRLGGPSAAFRRIMAKKTEDESREVTSSLLHKITRQPAPDGSEIISETRGIRRATWRTSVKPSRQAADARAENTFRIMSLAANRHLRATGEMDLPSVMDAAERSSASYPSEAKISQRLRQWVDNIKIQKGALSIDASAAKFLQSADHLLQILNKAPKMQRAAFEFAQAWHAWHLELFGEHELAAIAERSVAGLKTGPKALKRKRALREAIIETEYGKHVATTAKIKHGAERAANAILNDVAKEFEKDGLGSIEESTLVRTLRGLINNRGRSDD
jgi:hypothetical protein